MVMDGAELTFAVSVAPAATTRTRGRRPRGGRGPRHPRRRAGPRPWPPTRASSGAFSSRARRPASRSSTPYAHHPTEMTADLEAMRAAAGDARILVLFQPHLFSRTQELGKRWARALALADASVVLDIYPAARTRSPASPAS